MPSIYFYCICSKTIAIAVIGGLYAQLFTIKPSARPITTSYEFWLGILHIVDVTQSYY